MLTKIFKYESKAMGRTLLPLYLALIASSLITGLLLLVNGGHFFANDNLDFYFSAAGQLMEILTGIFFFAFALLIAGISVATLIAVINRFNKGCLGDEGYLTFTLPVGIDTQLWARILVSAFWTILSGIATALCIFIVLTFGNGGFGYLKDIGELLGELAKVPNLGTILAEYIALGVVTLLVMPLTVYFCMTLGQMIMPKHRIVGAFIVYFGMNLVAQILTMIFGVITVQEEYMVDYLMNVEFQVFFHRIFLFSLITELVTGFVFYFVVRFLLSRKLNLE